MKERCAGECVLPRASFGAAGHGRGGNGHRQTYQVRRAVGPDAVAGPGGEPLTNGATSEVTGSGQGVHAFAGVARDVFADERLGPGGLQWPPSPWAGTRPRCSRTTSTCSRPRHVAVIVLQVPTGLIGKGWCTAGPPSRCPGTPGDAGRPLRAAASHPPVHAGGTDARGLQRTRPWADNDRFTAQIADAAREITRRGGHDRQSGELRPGVPGQLGALTVPCRSAPRPRSTTPGSTGGRWPATS
jgi:hypothetical protein